MKSLFLPSCLILLFTTLIACGTSQPANETSRFEFLHDGISYEIVGSSDTDGAAINDLVQRSNGQIIFWARDQNRDGYIDRIYYGDIKLSEANQIYRQGILIAAEAGKYKHQPYPRTYEYADENVRYVLISVIHRESESYNRFTALNTETGREVSLIDSGMDGTLDSGQLTGSELDIWQVHYTRILQYGIDENKIEIDSYQRYIVQVNRERMRALTRR